MPQADGGWVQAPTERLVDILVDNARRQYLLIIVAYLTGGLGLSGMFVPTVWLSISRETATVVSILLMCVSFLSLFLVSIAAPGIENE